MHCANKAAADAAAQMRTASDQASPFSAAGDSSPAAANNQPATLNVAGARNSPRAASSSASSAVGDSSLDFDPE